jgi:hypothetical protein
MWQLSNPLQQKKKLQLIYDVNMLDNQFTPTKKSRYIEDKITELTIPIKYSLNTTSNINKSKKR